MDNLLLCYLIDCILKLRSVATLVFLAMIVPIYFVGMLLADKYQYDVEERTKFKKILRVLIIIGVICGGLVVLLPSDAFIGKLM